MSALEQGDRGGTVQLQETSCVVSRLDNFSSLRLSTPDCYLNQCRKSGIPLHAIFSTSAESPEYRCTPYSQSTRLSKLRISPTATSMAPNFWMNQMQNYLHVLQHLLCLWPTAPLQPFQLYRSSLNTSMLKPNASTTKLLAFALSHKVSGTLLLSLPTKLLLVRARPAVATPGGVAYIPTMVGPGKNYQSPLQLLNSLQNQRCVFKHDSQFEACFLAWKVLKGPN